MELLTLSIPVKVSNHNPIVVAPLGDIQWNGKNGPTAKETLQRYLDKAMEHDAWFLGMGDYTDFMSPSNRTRYANANLYDTTKDSIDDKALDLVLELYQLYLKPTKGRWLGMLHGHHYAQLETGETTDQRLCQLLGTRFLGTSAYIRLQFVRDKINRKNVVIWAHHGCGGGSLAGAPLNKLEHMASAFPAADIYVMGHTTKKPAVPIPRVIPRWHGQGAPDLVEKNAYLVNSGGFSIGWQHGSKHGRVPMGGYVEQRMLKPTALGAPLIRIVPNFKYKRGDGYNNGDWAPEISVEI